METSGSKMSKREMIRRSAVAAQGAPPSGLPDELEQMLVGYQPTGVDPAEWAAVSDVVVATMRASHITGKDSFQKHLGVVARYLLWRAQELKPVGFPESFNQADIDQYYQHGIVASDKTRNDYRSRLKNIARHVNDDPNAVVRVQVGAYQAVREGFTDAEMKRICWSVQREKSEGLRRQLCAAVGLCAGAGLSATDVKHLHVGRVVDHGDTGIEILVAGPNARQVWVREEFEALVRIGVKGLRPNDLVIGTQTNRRNVVGNLVQRSALHDCPHFDASRLRSTWLTWMLQRPVPLHVIMYAAGLTAARTLTDLIAHIDVDPDADTTIAALRTGVTS